MKALARLAHPFLFALDPERAHGLAIRAIASGVMGRSGPDRANLATRVLGFDLANPVGTAAGFDKHAEIADTVLDLGFGFAEIGGVTPLPQDGNPRPRVFRAIKERAVINRLGLNSVGMRVVRERLSRRRPGGVVGVNIGPNKDSADRIADYAALVECLTPVASFLTVNVSSPNTPGLRDLQKGGALAALLQGVVKARDAALSSGTPRRPVLVKIAPDLDAAGLESILAAVRASGVDGLVISNTTVSRDGLADARFAAETGGLSGAPLFERSTALVGGARLAMGPGFPIIGVGGIHSAETAYAKIRAGADLVQLYTGLIYEGAALVGRIKQGLSDALARDGLSGPAEAVGLDAEAWAAKARLD